MAWAAGKYLFVYDTALGKWEQQRKEVHRDSVRALSSTTVGCDTALNMTRWISAGDDKELILWEETGSEWQEQARLSHPKKLTVALFDHNGQVVFADRFGDVFRWSSKIEDEASLLLSHLAIVTAVAFTASGSYIVTGDNHEKVRVTSYPHGVQIRSFCLGHTGQITALAAPFGDEALISASADGTLRLWSLDGEELCHHNLGSAVSSLTCHAVGLEAVTAYVGCEAAPGLRKVVMNSSGKATSQPQHVADEAPQAVCLRHSDGALMWVDRRGHLRISGGEDIFLGEDIPAALVTLSKYAGEQNEAQDEAEADEEDEAGRAAKRRPK